MDGKMEILRRHEGRFKASGATFARPRGQAREGLAPDR